jgi:hypothetical protein
MIKPPMKLRTPNATVAIQTQGTALSRKKAHMRTMALNNTRAVTCPETWTTSQPDDATLGRT